MSTTIVYKLRGGTHEYRVTPEKWEQMQAKNKLAFDFIREETAKEVTVPSPEVQHVEAAPASPARGGRKDRNESKPKEVRGPFRLDTKPKDEPNEETPSLETGDTQE